MKTVVLRYEGSSTSIKELGQEKPFGESSTFELPESGAGSITPEQARFFNDKAGLICTSSGAEGTDPSQDALCKNTMGSTWIALSTSKVDSGQTIPKGKNCEPSFMHLCRNDAESA